VIDLNAFIIFLDSAAEKNASGRNSAGYLILTPEYRKLYRVLKLYIVIVLICFTFSDVLSVSVSVMLSCAQPVCGVAIIKRSLVLSYNTWCVS